MSHSTSTELNAAQIGIPPGHIWRKLPLVFSVFGVIGLGVGLFLGFGTATTHDHSGGNRFYFSYLVAYMYWLSIALGALFFVLIHHATQAGWSTTVRRVAESFSANLWVFALAFAPILIGMHSLFHWTHDISHDHVLSHKAPFLNPTFFLARASFYFIAWTVLGWWFWKASVAQDKGNTAGTKESNGSVLRIAKKLRARSYGALIVFAVTLTFAAFDWMMSLEPHWFSTMFGVIYFAGSIVAILALLAIVLQQMRSRGFLGGGVTDEHMHDIGKLLFGFTVFWTYVSFSQFMLIWYANMPEETGWYFQHMRGTWLIAARILGFGHFAVPFFFLMSRHSKRNPAPLTIGAIWMLCMHYLDLYWQIMPTIDPQGIHLNVMDIALFCGIGGIYLATVARLWVRHSLVAINDPRLTESLRFEQAI